MGTYMFKEIRFCIFSAVLLIRKSMSSKSMTCQESYKWDWNAIALCKRQREKCERSCFSEQCVQKCTVRHISSLSLNTFNKDPAGTEGGRRGMVVVCYRLGSIFCSLGEKVTTLI